MRFAVDVILYLRTVKNSVETMDMKRQLVKASTSSGANYEESEGSPTKPDAKTKKQAPSPKFQEQSPKSLKSIVFPL